jgi:hypothetical protein
LSIVDRQSSILIPIAFGADDDAFVGPSNWGSTGLMETPTARAMDENTYRLGAAQVFPYRYYYTAIGIFEGLEVSGRVTEVIGVKAFPGQGYGNTKDKAVELKYQFLPEGTYMPALALGIMDPHGTRIYSSQFLVASKQLYPFDFTVGLGNGRYGKRPLPASGDAFRVELFTDPRQWFADSQVFGGIQFSPSPKYSFMVEYNPTLYHKQTRDPALRKYFKRPVSSQVNFGFRWKPLKWTELGLSYQRGNEIGLTLSTTFEIGNPLVPIYDKPSTARPQEGPLSMDEQVALALKGQGFSDIAIDRDGEGLLVQAQNDRYFYSMRALGVILKTITPFLHDFPEQVRIILTDVGIPLFEVRTTRADILDLTAGRITPGEFFYVSHVSTGVSDVAEGPTRYKHLIVPELRPSFQSVLEQASSFFEYKLGAEGSLSYNPWRGGSFVGSVDAYVVNNVEPTVATPLEAVRSDFTAYRKQSASLGRLMFDQIYKPMPYLYSRFAAGFLEYEYAGVDGEVAAPFVNGRFFVGLQASLVKKRDPENPLGLLRGDGARDFYHVEFLNTRLNIPEHDVFADLKLGRFLGGDVGARITLNKSIKGVNLFAWYSFTNTNVFTDPFNRGYQDKGIGVSIPMRLFKGSDSKTAYTYSISPWTRDPGQDILRWRELFDFVGRDVGVFLHKDKKMVE